MMPTRKMAMTTPTTTPMVVLLPWLGVPSDCRLTRGAPRSERMRKLEPEPSRPGAGAGAGAGPGGIYMQRSDSGESGAGGCD